MRERGKSKEEASPYRTIKPFLFIGAICFILFSFVFIMNDEYLLVRNINIVGAEQIPEEDVENIVHSILVEKMLGLIPHTNIFFIPRASINHALRERFLTLDHVDIDVHRTEELQIRLVEKDPAYLYCHRPDTTEQTEGEFRLADLFNESCIYVDDEGLLFMESPYFSDNVYVKFMDIEGARNIGEYVYEDKAGFAKLKEILAGYRDRGAQVKKIYIEEAGDIRLVLSALGSRNLYGNEAVRINMASDTDTLLNTLSLLLAEETFRERFFDNREMLDYIDFRFGNKIIYRFRDEA